VSRLLGVLSAADDVAERNRKILTAERAPRCWYSGAPSTSAAAFAAAIEIATALLAPIAEKSSVPSAARSALSTARWSPA